MSDLLFIQEMQDISEFLLAQVEAIAGPENWGTPKFTRSQKTSFETNAFLDQQVPFIWSLLADEEKEMAVTRAETARKQSGRDFSRKSASYLNYLIDSILLRVLRDRDSGEYHVKQKLMLDWEQTKENLFAYNVTTGDKLYFERFLGIQKDQNVYMMRKADSDIKWVVKWEEPDLGKPNTESESYMKLKSMGTQTPEILDGFEFLGFGILVLEFLQPLDASDRPLEVGKQLLSQLSKIHTYACHFDLKTDNIRKRNSIPPKYFIIDMNLSEEMRTDGTVVREHFSPNYTSQDYPYYKTYILSSHVNDFIELSYVMHQMIAKRAYESSYSIFAKKIEFMPELKVEIFGLLSTDFFADPDRMILNDDIVKTARGWKTIRKLLQFPLERDLSEMTVPYMHCVQRLAHGFPAANIHAILSNFLDNGKATEDKFFQETQSQLQKNVECSVCTSIGAGYKCGGCYNEVAFICSGDCHQQHVCN